MTNLVDSISKLVISYHKYRQKVNTYNPGARNGSLTGARSSQCRCNKENLMSLDRHPGKSRGPGVSHRTPDLLSPLEGKGSNLCHYASCRIFDLFHSQRSRKTGRSRRLCRAELLSQRERVGVWAIKRAPASIVLQLGSPL